MYLIIDFIKEIHKHSKGYMEEMDLKSTPKTYWELLEDNFLKQSYERMLCWSFKNHSQPICL